jgi:hypothetical protein
MDVIGALTQARYCQFGVPDTNLGGGTLDLHDLRRQNRKRLGLSTYELEENSKKFADLAGIPDLKIDHSWLSRIETEDRATPSLREITSMSIDPPLGPLQPACARQTAGLEPYHSPKADLTVYSCRSATSGSTFVARREGIKPAMKATMINSKAMPAKVAGSVALTS